MSSNNLFVVVVRGPVSGRFQVVSKACANPQVLTPQAKALTLKKIQCRIVHVDPAKFVWELYSPKDELVGTFYSRAAAEAKAVKGQSLRVYERNAPKPATPVAKMLTASDRQQKALAAFHEKYGCTPAEMAAKRIAPATAPATTKPVVAPEPVKSIAAPVAAPAKPATTTASPKADKAKARAEAKAVKDAEKAKHVLTPKHTATADDVAMFESLGLEDTSAADSYNGERLAATSDPELSITLPTMIVGSVMHK